MATGIAAGFSASVDAQPHGTYDSLRQLRAGFEAASLSAFHDVVGEWVLAAEVSSERFLTERSGPDRIVCDESDPRSTATSGSPLEWVLSLQRDPAGQPQARSITAWSPSGDSTKVNLATRNELQFEKQYGGDDVWGYRCRTWAIVELICVLRGHEDGHGVVFHRLQR